MNKSTSTGNLSHLQSTTKNHEIYNLKTGYFRGFMINNNVPGSYTIDLINLLPQFLKRTSFRLISELPFCQNQHIGQCHLHHNFNNQSKTTIYRIFDPFSYHLHFLFAKYQTTNPQVFTPCDLQSTTVKPKKKTYKSTTFSLPNL